MKPIGGYFGLEVAEGRLPYPNAVPVNFGRGGLELIIRSRGYRKVWIPDYICPVVPRYLKRMGVAYEVYPINENLEPTTVPTLSEGEAFLYVNYFGIKDAYCLELERDFHSTTTTSNYNSLILDLTQAFYYEPTSADGFNSARKFFGVPDGAFAFGRGLSDATLPDAIAYDQCEPLLRRLDGDIAGGYKVFHDLDDAREERDAAKMSLLTRTLLASIDRSAAAKRRQSNFARLHASLAKTNELSPILQLQLSITTLSLHLQSTPTPLIYPYLISTGSELRKKLIEAKIFCPTYWPAIENPGPTAANFIANLVCVPIDQRYTADDLIRILEVING